MFLPCLATVAKELYSKIYGVEVDGYSPEMTAILLNFLFGTMGENKMINK